MELTLQFAHLSFLPWCRCARNRHFTCGGLCGKRCLGSRAICLRCESSASREAAAWYSISEQQLVYSKWPWPHTSFPATSLPPPPPMSASAIDTLRRVCCEQERASAHLEPRPSFTQRATRAPIDRNAHSLRERERERDENRTEAKGKTLPGHSFIVLRTL
jgi:hypothetical protein